MHGNVLGCARGIKLDEAKEGMGQRRDPGRTGCLAELYAHAWMQGPGGPSRVHAICRDLSLVVCFERQGKPLAVRAWERGMAAGVKRQPYENQTYYLSPGG